MFHEADVVVGPGGAGMFNTVFCRPGTKVVSIEFERRIRGQSRDAVRLTRSRLCHDFRDPAMCPMMHGPITGGQLTWQKPRVSFVSSAEEVSRDWSVAEKALDSLTDDPVGLMPHYVVKLGIR